MSLAELASEEEEEGEEEEEWQEQRSGKLVGWVNKVFADAHVF